MKHILVVDNDTITLIAAENALENKYHVSILNSADLMIDFLLNNQVDMILLAASIFEMDRFAINKQLKDRAQINKIPFIIMTGYNNLEQEKNALTHGAKDFISKPFLPEALINRVSTYLDLQGYQDDQTQAERFQDAISTIFAELVEFRDETTGGHIKNTTLYFRILLEEVVKRDQYKNLISTDDVRDLLRSAPLHDIGKIGINDDILRKSSPLDYQEYEYMKTHTTIGRDAFDRIIKETGGTRWLYLAKDIAYCHHERWDGKGYPNGLKGEEIPIYARILMIADVYDALTSRRTYKEAYSHQKAMKIIIEGKGCLFDPDLVDIFIEKSICFEQALRETQSTVK